MHSVIICILLLYAYCYYMNNMHIVIICILLDAVVSICILFLYVYYYFMNNIIILIISLNEYNHYMNLTNPLYEKIAAKKKTIEKCKLFKQST